MPTLAETEQLFYRLITAPAGVEDGLAKAGLAPRAVEDLIVGDARLSAIGRLDIYANMYFFRLLDCLREDFGKLAELYGESGFHNLVTDYLLAHPSRHPSVRNVGDRLPQFLVGKEPLWHADLARLEWARRDVFDAADDELLTRERLSAVAPESFAALPLTLISAVRLVPVEFAVDDLWPSEGETAPESPTKDARTLLVWRQDSGVYHRALGRLEARALDRVARGGAAFGHVCDLVCEEVASDEAPAAALGLLSQWLVDELVR